jgi:hypothetical protein
VPFAADVVAPIAAVTAVLHCIASAFGEGYWFNEVYMLAIGRRHLEMGIGRSTAVGARAGRVGRRIAPGSLIELRLPAVLATACAVVVAGLPRAAVRAARPHSGVR